MNVQIEVANQDRKVFKNESKSLRNEVLKLTKELAGQAGDILALKTRRSGGYAQTNSFGFSHLAVAQEPMFMLSPQANDYYHVEAPVTDVVGSFAQAHSQPLHHDFAKEPIADFVASFNAGSSQPVHDNVQAEHLVHDFVPAFSGDLHQPCPPVVSSLENPFMMAPNGTEDNVSEAPASGPFAAGPSDATPPAVNAFFATPPAPVEAAPSSVPTQPATVTAVPPLPTLGNDWTSKVEPQPESKEERLQRALERMKQNSESASYGKQSDRRARNAKRMGKR